MKVYLAARYGRREELLGCKSDLEQLGFTVTSRWLDGDHQIVDDKLCDPEHADTMGRQFAQVDIADLRDADICIFFSEIPRTSTSRGGRHVEFGFALALGHACRVIGPLENVFHCLSEVEVYDCWADYLATIPQDQPKPSTWDTTFCERPEEMAGWS